MTAKTWITLSLLPALLVAPAALAQESQPGLQGVAEYIRIEGDVQDGYIVMLHEGSYQLANEAYHMNMYGVVNYQPAVAISDVGREGAYPVVTSGTTNVAVSGAGGAISKGDFITSSDRQGVGQKATQAGFVLGVAQSSFEGGADETALIPVTVNINFRTSPTDEQLTPRAFTAQMQNVLTVGMRAVASEPNTALRYGAAAIVLIVSLGFGFLIFGRASTNGITAVGRNPLAKTSIIAVTGLNIIITIIFAAVGLVLAFLILAL